MNVGRIAILPRSDPCGDPVGLSKGGFSGLSSLAMPILSLGASPVRAAAIMLPIIIVQDWVSVWAFRHDFSSRNLIILVPIIDDRRRARLAARRPRQRRRSAPRDRRDFDRFRGLYADPQPVGRAPIEKPGVPTGDKWGSLAGFTSFISHSGETPFQVYVMPQYLKPRVFAGTATGLRRVNLVKIPPYFCSASSPARTWLSPPASFRWRSCRPSPASGWCAGSSADRFYAVILALTFQIGVKLTYDGNRALA